ncbi:MAG: HAD family hydrolase [Desulfobacteraceae bacterium]|nr:HAD family hydrolase [Desulfobacteraceae bacterium]
MNLALFDFDGTITHCDTFTRFIYLAVSHRRKLFGMVILSPLILGYKLKIVSGAFIRSKISKIGFSGKTEEPIRQLGKKYAREFLPTVLRPEAIAKINWHKQQGDKIVLVSASLSVYLSDWCEKHDFDLICTKLEINKGVYTGRYQEGDCTGKEKSRRILKRYNISDYNKIYAYGDSEEDKEMLSLANEKYYKWQKIECDK